MTLLAGPCCASPAQPTDPPPPAAFAPGAWRTPGLEITPTLSLNLGWNDNLRSAAQQPVASRFATWLPGLALLWPVSERNRVALNLRGELNRMPDSPADNSDNTEAAMDGAHLLDERTALAWKLAGQDWHDSIGLGESGETGEPAPTADHFHARVLAGVLRRDWDGLPGDEQAGELNAWRTELEASFSAKHYVNHRELTVLADVDSRQWVGRVMRRLDGGAHLGLELRDGQAHYPLQMLGLDNRDQRLYALWQREAEAPEAGVSGSLRLGWQRKRYRADFSEARPAWQGLSWELEGHGPAGAGQQWSLALQRAASDAPGDGVDRLLSRRLQLGWSWAISARSQASLSGSRQWLRYQGGLGSRQDQAASLDLALRHDVSRQCQIGLNLGWAQRRSSEPFARFSRHLNALTLALAI